MSRTESHSFSSNSKDDKKKKKSTYEYKSEIKHSAPNIDGLKRRPLREIQADHDRNLYPFEELENEALNNSLQATDTSDITSEQLESPGESCTDSKKESSNSKWWLICIFILAAVFIGYMLKHSTNLTDSSTEQLKVDVDKVIEDLKTEFVGQPDFTFRVVKAALRRVTLKEVSAPGILVLISSEKSQNTNSKFAHHLVKSISQHGGYGYISIQTKSVNKNESNANESNAHQLKKEIHMNITNNLTENPHLGILVDKLNQLPFEAAMIFHSYCDHENAPFKRTVYVMTVSVSEEISPASTVKEWDALASESLSKAWQGSNEDQVNSLISRLTGSVAAIVDKS